METFTQVETNLSRTDNFISVDAMTIMVNALKLKAQEKGRIFNGMVLHRSENKGADDQLVRFLNQLKQNASTLPDTRIQVIYFDGRPVTRPEVGHWSTFDLEIKDGRLNFFLLDARGSPNQPIKAAATIHSLLPQAKITYAGPSIQKDGRSCGYFALDNAFNLAKIETLHEQISECATNISRHDIYKTITSYSYMYGDDAKDVVAVAKSKSLNYVAAKNMPQNFGSLFKRAQNLRTYDESFANKGYQRHNQKPLDDYINEKKIIHIRPDNTETTHSNAVAEIKSKFQALAQIHLQKLGDGFTDVLEAQKNGNDLQQVLRIGQIANLHRAITKMKEHGEHISITDDEKGTIVVELAQKLEDKLNSFAAKNRSCADEYKRFHSEFSTLLHSQDKPMAEHRHYAKVIIANIALSLTLVGALFIAVKSISAGRFSLFFDKTQREENIKSIDEQLKRSGSDAHDPENPSPQLN